MKYLKYIFLIICLTCSGTAFAGTAYQKCRECQQFATIALELGDAYGCDAACGLAPLDNRYVCNKYCVQYQSGKSQPQPGQCKSKTECALWLCREMNDCPK